MSTSFISSNYTLTPLLKGFRHAPRFGHTQDVSLLVAYTNSQDPYRYGLGTICIAGIISGFFFVWALVLVLFIFMGPVKVGFLSGFHMRQPKSSIIDHENGIHSFRLPRIVHSTFLLSSAIVIVCAVLLVVQGVKPFLKPSLANNLFTVSSYGIYDADSTIANFNQIETIAPVYIDAILPSRFCPYSNSSLTFDQSRNLTMSQLSNFSINFKVDGYYDLRTNVFSELEKRAKIFKQNIDKYGLKSWHGLAFSIPIIITAFLMMVGTILSWSRSTIEWFITFLTWILLPFLILVVVFSVTGCCAASILLVMNSDFCAGKNFSGPGGTISDILSLYLIPQRYPKLYEGFKYISNRCQGTSPFSFLNSDISFVADTLNSIGKFKQTLNSTGVNELALCNVSASQYAAIQSYTTNLYSNLLNISRSVSDASSLVNCATLYPIYDSVVYQDVCTLYPQYFMWVFSTLLGISVFGMIMITFRASWLMVKYQSSVPNLLVNTPRSPDSVNGSATPPRERQRRGHSDVGNIYDHETLLSDKYEKRDNISILSWEDISVADDYTIREVRRNQDQYAPGMRIY